MGLNAEETAKTFKKTLDLCTNIESYFTPYNIDRIEFFTKDPSNPAVFHPEDSVVLCVVKFLSSAKLPEKLQDVRFWHRMEFQYRLKKSGQESFLISLGVISSEEQETLEQALAEVVKDFQSHLTEITEEFLADMKRRNLITCETSYVEGCKELLATIEDQLKGAKTEV
jgi:hypothetical protein